MHSQLAGFALESDYMLLSNELVLNGNLLNDQATNANHKLHPNAVLICRKLQRGCTAGELYKLADKKDIASQSVTELALFLNSIGGLIINRSLGGHITLFGQRLKNAFRYAVLPETLTTRFSTKPKGIMLATARTIAPLVLALSLSAGLLYGAGLEKLTAAFICLTFVAVLYVSVVVHELSHLWVIQKQIRPAGALMQNGLRLGIVHRKLSKKYEVICALIGPFMGVISTLVISSVLGLVVNSPIVLVIGALIALVHVLALLPSYSDGKVLWGALKQQGNL